MTPTNGLKSFPTLYAADSDYVHKTYADYQTVAAENYAKGFEPLQTLPASWYNSLFYLLTEQAQATKLLCDSIFAELQSVLTAGDVTPSAAYTNQLLEAIEKITELNIATGSALGGIKSSALAWNVAVDASTGVASVNTVDATTSAKGIVQLDGSLTSSDSTKAGLASNVAKAFKNGVFRGTCSTTATTAIKQVTLDTNDADFQQSAGVAVLVKFSNASNVANAQLKIATNPAAAIKYNSGNATRGGNYYTWKAGEYVLFVFDGSAWILASKSCSMNLSSGTLYIEG